MKLSEVKKLLNADVIFGEELIDQVEVETAFASDLLSDVLAYSKENALFLTGLTNPQVIRTVEVLDLVGRMGQDAAARPSAPAAPQDLLSAADQVVWAALPIRAATSVDALVFATGVAPGALMAALTRLELAGLAARVGADWRRRVP